MSLGQTLAGLLNATFGNAVEVIVGLVALFKGEYRIVQTSVCTRILHISVHVFTVCRCLVLFYRISFWFWVAPSLLVCWCISFFESVRSLRTRKAGIRKHESEFAVKAAQTLYFASPLQQWFRTDTIHPQECFGENPPYFSSSVH